MNKLTDTPRTDACPKCKGTGINQVWVVDTYEPLRCNLCMPPTTNERRATLFVFWLVLLSTIAFLLTI